MAVQDVFPKNPCEVVIHIGVDVVELADEGVFDPVSNRLGGWVKETGEWSDGMS
jgi:phosphotransferase system IIA component